MNYYARYYRRTSSGNPGKLGHLDITSIRNTQFALFPGRFVRRPGSPWESGFKLLIRTIAGVSDFMPILPIVNTLKENMDSLEAVAIVPQYGTEYRRLLSVQFQTVVADRFIRILTGTFNLRAADILSEFPIDLVVFGGVTLALSNILNLPANVSVINTANSYVINDSKLFKPKFEDGWEFSMPFRQTWADYENWAKNLMTQQLTNDDLMKEFAIRRPE